MRDFKSFEDQFIAECQQQMGELSGHLELTLRYAYGRAAAQFHSIGFQDGVRHQKDKVLDALGAAPREEMVHE